MKKETVSNVSGRGFVTIATGNPKYYQMAVNLLYSYRQYSNDSAPFSLICDCDCPEAREFDSFVLIQDAKNSYLDKLSLYQYTPYEETIFIDADALILADTQILWDDFANKPDFSCYGRVLPLDSRDGWFFYEEMGDLKPQLSYGISMHGGLYYLRKTPACREIFEKARYFANHYHQYTFANFKTPADEPVLALAMALAGGKPCDTCAVSDRVVFLPSFDERLRVNRKGVLMLDDKVCEAPILHFGNRNLSKFLYQYLLAILLHRRTGAAGIPPLKTWLQLRFRHLPRDAKVFRRKIKKKLKATILRK